MVELVGGGSDITGATLVFFSVSVLLSALVKRFGVSCRQYFYSVFFLQTLVKPGASTNKVVSHCNDLYHCL